MRKVFLMMAVTAAMVFSQVANTFAEQTFDWIRMTQYITYAADGVTETSRSETDLDHEGRITDNKVYSDGTLFVHYRDYQYTELTLTVWMDTYSGGNLSSSTKYQYTYLDKNRMQTTQSISYAEDGVTETGLTETDYDNDGRETGYRSYSNGTLSQQRRDYQYNGRTVTYWNDNYSGGNLSSSRKHQQTYSDKNWVQQTQSIAYAADGVTESSRIETDYDNDGRETGYRQYSNGTLLTQRRDYQYDGRTIICWIDSYSGGNVTSSSKYLRTYASIANSPNSIENVTSNSISIYPNPTAGILQISGNVSDVQQVSIFNLSGIEVLNTKNTTIDISYFSAGMYIVRVPTQKGIFTEKILKY